MTPTLEQAAGLFPLCPRAGLAKYYTPMIAALEHYDITTPERIAAWAAQVGHESLDLRRWQESFAYDVAGLLRTFPRYFPTAEVAAQYVGKPSAIADRVYANRYGNGPEDSGDGSSYCGRGPMQHTFRDNYAELERALRLPLLDAPDMLLHASAGFSAAGYYWHSRRLNSLADQGRFDEITRLVNGGDSGAADRRARHARCRRVLGLDMATRVSGDDA